MAQDRIESNVRELKAAYRAFQLEVAALRFALLVRKFNPNQPRVPAGSPHAGEWTRGGGGGGGGDGEPGDILGGFSAGAGDLFSLDGTLNLDSYWPTDGDVVPESGDEFDAPIESVADNGYTRGTNERAREPFVAPDGTRVLNKDNQQMTRASEFPPEFFVRKGEEAGRDIRDMMRLDQPAAALSRLAQDLYRFRQGGEWDVQRGVSVFDKDLRDYSTVAIGLYAAASGLTEDQILFIQNSYAWLFSRFDEEMDPDFRSLALRNVWNTRYGFALFRRHYQLR